LTGSLWLSISAYLATIPLIYHFYRYKGGAKQAAGFFGSAIAYGIVRENILALLNPAYHPSGFIGFDIWIGLAPLTIPVGWAFTVFVFLCCYFAFAYYTSRWRYTGLIGIALHFAQLIIFNTVLTA